MIRETAIYFFVIAVDFNFEVYPNTSQHSDGARIRASGF